MFSVAQDYIAALHAVQRSGPHQIPLVHTDKSAPYLCGHSIQLAIEGVGPVFGNAPYQAAVRGKVENTRKGNTVVGISVTADISPLQITV